MCDEYDPFSLSVTGDIFCLSSWSCHADPPCKEGQVADRLVFSEFEPNIIDVFPAEEKDMVRSMLSESLQAVISQTLLKRVNGGRVAAHEIMIGTPAIRNLVREDKVAQMYSVIQTGQKYGMQTMGQSLQQLIAQGSINQIDTNMPIEGLH